MLFHTDIKMPVNKRVITIDKKGNFRFSEIGDGWNFSYTTFEPIPQTEKSKKSQLKKKKRNG